MNVHHNSIKLILSATLNRQLRERHVYYHYHYALFKHHNVFIKVNSVVLTQSTLQHHHLKQTYIEFISASTFHTLTHQYHQPQLIDSLSPLSSKTDIIIKSHR